MGCIYLLYNQEGYGYIGRTNNIKLRLLGHKALTNCCMSKILQDWKCEILEEVDNDYLVDYERYYYDMYNEMFPNMLVNNRIPLQTKKEKHHKWYKKNVEKKKNYTKENRKNNPEKYNKKTICECGGKYLYTNKLKHSKTTKHQNFIY